MDSSAAGSELLLVLVSMRSLYTIGCRGLGLFILVGFYWLS
jgi:hypothetical protein